MIEGAFVALASGEAVFAWLGTTSFIVAYHLGNKGWRLTPVGRTMMSRAFSMWIFLTFALTNRLLDPIEPVRLVLALLVYLTIGLMEWQLFLILRAAQKGKITLENPHYTPVRDWWRRVTTKKEG